MRFTHLAEFSEYAKYQPFKFYLLIFVIACFPVTYARGTPLLGHHRQRRGSSHCHDKRRPGTQLRKSNKRLSRLLQQQCNEQSQQESHFKNLSKEKEKKVS